MLQSADKGRAGWFPALAAVTAGLVSCGERNEFIPPPPPPVTVATPEVRDVTVFETFPGTLEGIAQVEIRARVRGILQKCHFKDGQLVGQGEPLCVIEPEPYEAARRSAEASRDQAVAARDLATANRMRFEKAFQTNAVSEIEVLVAKAEEDEAKAAVKQAEANLENARIELSYTTIKAPVAGRLSRALVDVGNLVEGSQATLLTTIVDDTSVRAYFELTERAVLPYLPNRPKPGGDQQLQVRDDLQLQLQLTDGSVYPEPGKLDFIDNKIDPATRTVRVRAVFPNPEGKLAAGQFARVGIPFHVEGAVLVPARAIQRDLEGDYVWVVVEDNIVRRRSVEAGRSLGDRRIIGKGLDGRDLVIVAGLQRAREGAAVAPHPEEPPQGTDAAPPEDARNDGDRGAETAQPESGE